MRFGFVMPFGDARTTADFAVDAERAGWDGFFVWEPVWGVDAWVSLTAAAMQTTSIRLGTLLSPLSRMRPWELASKTATLDNLSGGRVILSVGLGAVGTGFAEFGEETDLRVRAELLDEGLDILTGLWQGQPFHYEGKHYNIEELSDAPPPPLQTPRILIWVVAAYPHPKSLDRALKYDGIIPSGVHGDDEAGLATLGELEKYIAHHRTATTPFDVVIDYKVSSEHPRPGLETLKRWSDSGVTWWIEGMWQERNLDNVRTYVRQGPPRLEN